jgi:hypothetical protein
MKGKCEQARQRIGERRHRTKQQDNKKQKFCSSADLSLFVSTSHETSDNKMNFDPTAPESVLLASLDICPPCLKRGATKKCAACKVRFFVDAGRHCLVNYTLLNIRYIIISAASTAVSNVSVVIGKSIKRCVQV